MKERRNAMKERLENGLVDIYNDDDNDDEYFNERGATATDDEQQFQSTYFLPQPKLKYFLSLALKMEIS